MYALNSTYFCLDLIGIKSHGDDGNMKVLISLTDIAMKLFNFNNYTHLSIGS